MGDEPDKPAIVVEVRGDAKGRLRLVRLSDGREFVFSEEACSRAGVGIGWEATEELLGALDRAEQRVTAHDAALRLLSHRSRSESEMRNRLRMRGIEAAAIDEEVARLRDAGLLNDVQFARAWVEDRKRLSPRGRRLLRYELLGRGIAPESVDAATEEVDDLHTARQLATSRARGSALANYEVFMSRVGGFLRRRGFAYDVVAVATREAWTAATGVEPGADAGVPGDDAGEGDDTDEE